MARCILAETLPGLPVCLFQPLISRLGFIQENCFVLHPCRRMSKRVLLIATAMSMLAGLSSTALSQEIGQGGTGES